MRYYLLIFIVFSSLRSSAQNENGRFIFEKMYQQTKNLKSASFKLVSTERMSEKKLSRSEMLIKLETSPYRIYMYAISPNPGLEALWIENFQDNKMLINPNGFPYFSLKFDPYSSVVRKNTHHTIGDIGFRYFSSMIEYYIDFYGENFYNYIQLTDTLIWENRSCFHLIYDFKDYDYILYSVKKDETLTTIAAKYHLSDYHLLEINTGIKDYHSVRPGQIIRIPNFYCRKIELYVDRITYMPLVQMIFDEKGLFEKYELKSLIINPFFLVDEFSSVNKKYGF